eukprot:CAMPEP_0115866540 /NCGR_PEP_ID=MMETSP0287-20121206/20302_1 /TAXON_ID=412157 /ORGANISM="Chrysochromulina rotalis, Strain UIO044" /LENGTH=83 /DNA_ID=CAMNT_0003321111 /DNA_START=218 /DNA_END=466 /DNA_ORIENTATION=-
MAAQQTTAAGVDVEWFKALLGPSAITDVDAMLSPRRHIGACIGPDARLAGHTHEQVGLLEDLRDGEGGGCEGGGGEGGGGEGG